VVSDAFLFFSCEDAVVQSVTFRIPRSPVWVVAPSGVSAISSCGGDLNLEEKGGERALGILEVASKETLEGSPLSGVIPMRLVKPWASFRTRLLHCTHTDECSVKANGLSQTS
jgi:hypothetical protein